MTATATPIIAQGVQCPKCGSAMIDDRNNKRSDKSPDYTCSNMLCVQTRNGKSYRTAIWAKDAPPAPPPKPPAPKNGVSYGHPGFLEGAEQQEAAELQKRIGFDISKIQTDLSLYQSITEWYLATMVPVLTKADVGCSPESVNAAVATIFIQAKK